MTFGWSTMRLSTNLSPPGLREISKPPSYKTCFHSLWLNAGHKLWQFAINNKKETTMDDGTFRSGHDNFIYILWQNFHFTVFSLFSLSRLISAFIVRMNISSGVQDINIAAWHKSYNEEKQLETDFQYINFHRSFSGTFLISSVERRQKINFFWRHKS